MRIRRPGQSSLFALFALPVMLGALVLVLMIVRQRDTGTELRNAAVAAALAAAGEIADDALLTDDPDRIRGVFDRGYATAGGVARKNLVEGKWLVLTPPAEGRSGDILFGYHDSADGVEGQFRPLPNHPTGADLGKVNAARLTARHPFRDGVFTRLTAVFDRHVVGFRPLPDRPAPVVPVALYDGPHEDHRPACGHAAANGSDEWEHNADESPFRPGHDGIREFTVRVGWQKPKGDGAVCGFPLHLAGAGRSRVFDQITEGLSAADLHKSGGDWRLGDDGTLPAHGDVGLLTDDEGEDRPLKQFRKLARSGEVRVWPVFSQFAEDDIVVLVGFTAARVIAAERERDTDAIRLTLQPAVIATPTALTDPTRPVRDRTVGRVRIAG